MPDLPTQPEPLRLENPVTLSGANWAAPRSVLIASVSGRYAPASWPAVRALLARLLPAGLPEGDFPAPPEDAAAAVETLAVYILDWLGHPPPKVQRTAAGRRAAGLAIIPLGSADMTRTTLHVARMILDQAAASDGPDSDWPGADWIHRMRGNLLNTRQTATNWLPLSRGRLVRAAEARGIPWRLMQPAPQALQLGEGRHARRFEASTTWRTSAVGVSLAADKRHGNQMLRRCGLPAARQEVVASADEVRAAAARFGLPLVLKPTSLRLGQGMQLVYRAADIDDAWAVSSGFGQKVVAESYIPGNEYRVLVIDGALVSVLLRVPATVTGDGRATIAELVERESRDPRRGGEADGFPLEPIATDTLAERYLESRGLTYASVPDAGEVVQVHPLPMIRHGGGGRLDVTDQVHPENRRMAERAVGVFGLDVAGIDLRMPDIARSWREVGAGICEVNPQPNLNLHYDIDTSIDVAGHLLDRCYPPADRGPMRHVLLLGDGDLDPHLAAVAGAMRERFGWRVGTVSRSGVDLDGWRPDIQPRTLPAAYGLVVEDSSLDAAVYAVPPAAAVATGLGMERVDVALIAPANPGSTRARDAAAAILQGIGRPPEPLPEAPEGAAALVLAALERVIADG